MAKPKWAHLKNKLPPLPDSDPKHKELVELAKGVYRAKPLAELLKSYCAYREKKDELKVILSALQISVDAHEALIIEHYDAQAISKMTLETGETISTSPEPYAQVIDKKAMVEWAKSHGLGSALTLPWQTLNSELKALLENGQPAQSGVTAFIRTKVLFRKND